MTGRRTHIRIPIAGRLITPLGQEYASVEALSGIALLLAAVVALVWANSPSSASYTSFWGYDVTATLESEGVQKFSDSYVELLEGIDAKRAVLA